MVVVVQLAGWVVRVELASSVVTLVELVFGSVLVVAVELTGSLVVVELELAGSVVVVVTSLEFAPLCAAWAHAGPNRRR